MHVSLILKKLKLLKEIRSSQKYGTSAQKGGTSYFNIRWKLIANEILCVLMKNFNQNIYACELN
jgi:hypothetical protein